MKYGKEKFDFEFPEEHVIKEIVSNEIEVADLTQKKIVEKAIENPISSERLKDIVKEGDTVCVVIPDITRGWQSPDIYVPPVIEELKRGGVKDEDILIVSATGSHRSQTEEEYIKLVSEDVYKRIEVIDHDCKDEDNLVHVGTTSRGNIIKLNKRAMECDHLVLTGGVIYHFLAGFGGGRKYVLPGIAGYDTIMKNHSFSFNEGLGSGLNSYVKSGNMTDTNPIHSDMMEAASFVKPTFIMNTVIDANKKITHAFAGDYIKAHVEGVKVIETIDTIEIGEKAEMVIASACGYPKDMNLYQTTKTMFNAMEALEDKGIMILVSECSEGFGSKDTEYIIREFTNNLDREKDIRAKYNIGKGLGYSVCQNSKDYTMILVTSMDQELFENTEVKAVKTIDEALELAYEIKGRKDMKTYMMPHGANTLPKSK
jgi:nickel-dependent lactate racemase